MLYISLALLPLYFFRSFWFMFPSCYSLFAYFGCCWCQNGVLLVSKISSLFLGNWCYNKFWCLAVHLLGSNVDHDIVPLLLPCTDTEVFKQIQYCTFVLVLSQSMFLQIFILLLSHDKTIGLSFYADFFSLVPRCKFKRAFLFHIFIITYLCKLMKCIIIII